MRDLLKMLGFFIQFLIVTIILTACFSGLYTLAHIGGPRYKNNREQLWADAGAWGIMMTGVSFLSTLILVVCSVIFNDVFILFLAENPELITLSFLSIVGILGLGLVSGLVMLFDE